ncbi:Transmembrane protein of unknown function [Geodermatophilus telluris]|uniref:DUF3566 domain-containing protein n=1 Tax=Geodermatophilus telluris TaxID=1190417 RepID=A0A1G6U5Z6_9ACTN|nr:DUF3566 domain-containing protein [Geodermatophilus telluris]SDD36723.1 Transmembrane protein of unknown function [Geodermatophilus telluris]
MSDRPQAVRTGTRPDGAAGADRTPGADPASAGGPAAGASAAGTPAAGGPPTGASAASGGTAPVATTAPPSGGVPLGKPATGQAPAQAVAPAPAQAPASAPQGGSSGTTQTITPAAAAAARPPAAAPGQQQAGSGKAPKRGPRGPRRARLQLRHIDTWSALKISLVLSIAMFFIWMVAVGILYGVLSGVGVFDTLNDLFGQLGTASGGEGGGDVITPGVVFGGAAVIGAINIVLMTALCTVAAFIYNLCADLVGGLEVTLAERE